jgi:hypothetical protein
MDYCRALKFE